MKQEHKDLLLKDLCARLQYGVRAEIINREDIRRQVVVSYGNICYVPEIGNGWWKECKPYLFPMSSMTEEQKTSHNFLKHSAYANSVILIDFYIKNHFDYRGLIPKGLAIDATGKNIY